MLQYRPIFHGIQRRYSTSYLTSFVPQQSTILSNKPRGNSMKTERLPPRSVENLIITPNDLTNKFRTTSVDSRAMSLGQKVFNSSRPRLAWTLANYNEIPDVKDSKYTPLPEVLFLGHTNTGKSSLINNLLVSRQQGKTSGASTEYAYVNSHAGYTKTMNCFNISNKFSLVDSPGYGEYGEAKQGEMVVEYLERRRVLRRVFLLIDSTVGFREEDVQLLDLLHSEGLSYEIVFTKVDIVILKMMKQHDVEVKKVQDIKKRQENYDAVIKANEAVVEYYEKMVQPLKLSPRYVFNNAVSNRWVQGRYGYKEIRAIVVESVGMGSGG